MRFLVKPGWLAFIVLVIGFAVACYTLLAPWQFRRNAEQQRLNQAIAASYTHPPAPLNQLVPTGAAPDPGVEWRQVVVRGEYLPSDEALVRLRSVEGGPALEVLTALRTDDGRVVAVDRGYVRTGAGSHVQPFAPAPAGPVTLTARLRVNETDPDHRAPLLVDGRQQVYAADSRQLAQVTRLPVAPGYLQLVADQAGGLGVLPLPDTDDGPFLSYAWQWLTFGAMALFGLGYFVRLEILQRRAPRDPAEPGRETPDAAEPDSPEPVREPTTRDLMAQRYGR